MPQSESLLIVEPRHGDALDKLVRVTTQMIPETAKYVLVLVDGPEYPDRKASYRSNMTADDVKKICKAIIDE